MINDKTRLHFITCVKFLYSSLVKYSQKSCRKITQKVSVKEIVSKRNNQGVSAAECAVTVRK